MTRVLAGGCFNKIHEGHLYFLKEARKLGDELVIVLANDSHNKKPYAAPMAERKEQVENLGIADKIVEGDAEGFVETVLRENPEIIALGYDQKLPKDVKEKLAKLNVKVTHIRKFGDFSTARIASQERA